MKNNKIKLVYKLCFIFIIIIFFSSCSFEEYWKNAILGKIPGIKDFIQKKYDTYTSIVGIEDKMQLVTAKQQIDFINILDGKDGRYLEISTYEVKAGIDCAKIVDNDNGEKSCNVEILSCSNINSIIIRGEADKNEDSFYEDCVKPVKKAYLQKAKDYAVELGLLNEAKKGAQNTIKNLTNTEIGLDITEYKELHEIKYLPIKLDIAKEYFDKNKIQIELIKDDYFYRDSLILKDASNDGWSIRIGDTGRTFSGTFEEFYKNVLETNSNENNLEKEKVEIFRYFDPMYPKECELLGYASDNYKTLFLLDNSRIYYIDAVCSNKQTLIDEVSPIMIYIATSLRKITDYKVEKSDEYYEYISNYFNIQENFRNNDSPLVLENNIEKLCESNTVKKDDSYSSDEKYFLAFSDIKNISKSQNIVMQTDDIEFNKLTSLIKDLCISSDMFMSKEYRDSIIKIVQALDTKVKKENKESYNLQYLLTWFLQNKDVFNFTDTEILEYKRYIEDGFIASRPYIIDLDDRARNKYFYNLFANKLKNSQYFVDTAMSIENDFPFSEKEDNNLLFAYYKIPEEKKPSDGDIYDWIKKQNCNKDITNSFILVFRQTEWDFGLLGKDDDVHAIVLDDSTLRFFPNVGKSNILGEIIPIEDNLVIKGTSLFNIIRKKDSSPIYFYYGDWKNLRISPENITINGQSYGTKKVTKKGKDSYRNSNDYAEKSAIAFVLQELQQAYSNSDTDYYYKTLCSNLEDYIQDYVYNLIWRPSPRMILDSREDKMQRYNY